MKIKTTTKDGFPRAKSFKLCGAKVTHRFDDGGMVQLRYNDDAKMYEIYLRVEGLPPLHYYFTNLKRAKKVLFGLINHTPYCG